MSRCLVVAHQTAESPELLDCLRTLAGSDPKAEFVLLVPATPVCNTFVCDEEETARVAHNRAQAATALMQQEGLRVTAARVGDADPIEAIRDELLLADAYDTVVISTLPPGISRWLKMDVPSRASRLLPGKVIPVIARTVLEPVQEPREVAAQP